MITDTQNVGHLDIFSRSQSYCKRCIVCLCT